MDSLDKDEVTCPCGKVFQYKLFEFAENACVIIYEKRLELEILFNMCPECKTPIEALKDKLLQEHAQA